MKPSSHATCPHGGEAGSSPTSGHHGGGHRARTYLWLWSQGPALSPELQLLPRAQVVTLNIPPFHHSHFTGEETEAQGGKLMFKVTGSLLGSWNIKVTESTYSGCGKRRKEGRIANTTSGQHSLYRCGFYTGEICPRSHGQAMTHGVLRTLRPLLARVTTAGHDFLPQSWDLPGIGVLVPPQGSAWPPLYSPLHLRLG